MLLLCDFMSNRVYSKLVIENMYRAEGRSPEDAKDRAAFLYKELKNMDQRERRLWNKVRKYEVTFSDLWEI